MLSVHGDIRAKWNRLAVRVEHLRKQLSITIRHVQSPIQLAIAAFILRRQILVQRRGEGRVEIERDRFAGSRIKRSAREDAGQTASQWSFVSDREFAGRNQHLAGVRQCDFTLQAVMLITAPLQSRRPMCPLACDCNRLRIGADSSIGRLVAQRPEVQHKAGSGGSGVSTRPQAKSSRAHLEIHTRAACVELQGNPHWKRIRLDENARWVQ